MVDVSVVESAVEVLVGLGEEAEQDGFADNG